MIRCQLGINRARNSHCRDPAVGFLPVRTIRSRKESLATAPTAARKTCRACFVCPYDHPRNPRSSPPRSVGSPLIGVTFAIGSNLLFPGMAFAIGSNLLSRNGFCLPGKADLHPLAFYTFNLTSPRKLFGQIVPTNTHFGIGRCRPLTSIE